MLYYDIDSFIALENEKADLVELCIPITNQVGEVDFSLGIQTRSTSYRAIELQGYAVQSRYSSAAINAGGNPPHVGEYEAYLNAKTFNPSMLVPNALMGVNHRYYQIEVTEPIYNRAIVIYYVATLIENSNTASSIAIKERLPLIRRTF